MPKYITVGYFDLREKKHISGIVIDNNFLKALKRYVKIITIPVNKKKDFEDTFSKLEKYRLDYLYIDSFNLLLESFLLREKNGSDIPFIVTLHTVSGDMERYIYLVPLIRKYDVIYAVSDYARKSFLRISDKFTIHVIPHCLDIDSIRNNVLSKFKKSTKLITFMGRIKEQKGIGLLIKCMPEIIARVKNAHLNIIGPLSGDKIEDKPKSQYVRELQSMVRQLKLTNAVHFKGVQTGLSKYKILSESDIFVSPTTATEETFLMANLEALACGVPVITTNWAGNKELVSDGNNGFLIDVDYNLDKKPKIDAKQLISKILKILKNEQLNLKMRKNALRSAQRYDYRQVLPRLVRLLKNKPQNQPRGERWSLIKDKTVADFRSSFNKGFFLFVIFEAHFKKNTYAVLYKNFLLDPHFNRKKRLPSTKTITKSKNRYLTMVEKLRQYRRDVLLLKSD